MLLKAVIVLLAVSKLGKTAPFVVTPKAKVNSVYYCYEVLARELPVIFANCLELMVTSFSKLEHRHIVHVIGLRLLI